MQEYSIITEESSNYMQNYQKKESKKAINRKLWERYSTIKSKLKNKHTLKDEFEDLPVQ